MKEIVKFYDKTLKLYLDIEFELKAYFKLVKKVKFRKNLSDLEKEQYINDLKVLKSNFQNILKRLRERLNIISIEKYL